jgi:hypothetical protein
MQNTKKLNVKSVFRMQRKTPFTMATDVKQIPKS